MIRGEDEMMHLLQLRAVAIGGGLVLFVASLWGLFDLRDLRTERGWTQSELAARLSVSRQTVNALEADCIATPRAVVPPAFRPI